MVDLAMAIQNHPDRVHMARKLQKQFPQASIETDYELSGAWGALRKILVKYQDNTSTHLLIIHDDVLPCVNFLDHVHAAIRVVPGLIFSCFMSLSIRTDRSKQNFTESVYYRRWQAGKHWYNAKNYWVTSQAIVYPISEIGKLIAWSDDPANEKFMFHQTPTSLQRKNMDDVRVWRYVEAMKQRKLVTVPCLVEHVGAVSGTAENVKGKRVNPGNMAFMFEYDPGEIDWMIGLDDV